MRIELEMIATRFTMVVIRVGGQNGAKCSLLGSQENRKTWLVAFSRGRTKRPRNHPIMEEVCPDCTGFRGVCLRRWGASLRR